MHVKYLSRDILPQNHIYNMIYREIGTFLPILTPDFDPFRTQYLWYWCWWWLNTSISLVTFLLVAIKTLFVT